MREPAFPDAPTTAIFMTTLQGKIEVFKSLERDGLIRRRAIATAPVTVEYSITPLGATLAAAVDPLRDWAERHLKEVLVAQRRNDAQQKPEAA